MRKIKSIIFTIISVFIITVSAFASNITVKLNGETMQFNQNPIIMNDRVMVPMRGIFESLGYSVNWNEENQSVVANKDNITINLRVGSAIANVNGEKYTLDSPPVIVNGNTMVPVRFISDQSGATVEWNDSTKTVYISNQYSFSVEEASKSVVQLNTNLMQGSGIMIGDGIIATNRHVIKNAGYVKVLFSDYTTYSGDVRVIGFDEALDIAILKIDKTGNNYLQMANSDNVSVGDKVTAIGSPMGRFNVVTTGIVTGKAPNLIVTSAKIQQGSSGGVLLNNSGNVIGMTFSYDSGNNYFSIPSNDIKAVALDKNLTLDEYRHYEDIVKTPENFKVTKTDKGVDLYWEPIYDADGYYVYMSNTIDGVYTETMNPITDSYKWYWGYPKSFGIRTKSDFKTYVKIATLKDGVLSELSQPIELVY